MCSKEALHICLLLHDAYIYTLTSRYITCHPHKIWKLNMWKTILFIKLLQSVHHLHDLCKRVLPPPPFVYWSRIGCSFKRIPLLVDLICFFSMQRAFHSQYPIMSIMGILVMPWNSWGGGCYVVFVTHHHSLLASYIVLNLCVSLQKTTCIYYMYYWDWIFDSWKISVIIVNKSYWIHQLLSIYFSHHFIKTQNAPFTNHIMGWMFATWVEIPCPTTIYLRVEKWPAYKSMKYSCIK